MVIIQVLQRVLQIIFFRQQKRFGRDVVVNHLSGFFLFLLYYLLLPELCKRVQLLLREGRRGSQREGVFGLLFVLLYLLEEGIVVDPKKHRPLSLGELLLSIV